MKPLDKLRRRQALPAVPREELQRRGEALRTALDTGGLHFPPETAERVRAVESKVGQRTSLAGSRTIAALAGATGSGKSSLFNYLVGEPVSRIGARRPTTSATSAAIWGEEPSAEVLDWLQVDARHHVSDRLPQADVLDGLVLLDLPDFDSRVTAHRAEADRVLRLVDVFVWVTDPQKYADAILHDEYVREMASHAGVTIAVMNQIDRLSEADAQATIEDLTRLFGRDGLTDVRVIGTSVVTHQGLEELVAALGEVVQSRNAAEHRLLGDLREQARALRAQVGDSEPRLPKKVDGELVVALEKAAGVPVVLDAVERDYRRHAVEATGWPLTRWTTKLRPAPLRRLGLQELMRDEDIQGMSRSQARAATGRSSLPAPSPAARAAVEVTTRRLGERASEGLPPSWAASVQDAATPDDRSMVDALDQAVTSTPLESKRPAWWGLVGFLQWVLAAVAVAGLAWLLLLMVLGWAQIDVGAPTWGPLPIPLLMLVGGLLLGVTLAALSRWLAARAARRRRQALAKELRDKVSGVARSHILAPVDDVLARHARTREALDTAAA